MSLSTLDYPNSWKNKLGKKRSLTISAVLLIPVLKCARSSFRLQRKHMWICTTTMSLHCSFRFRIWAEYFKRTASRNICGREKRTYASSSPNRTKTRSPKTTTSFYSTCAFRRQYSTNMPVISKDCLGNFLTITSNKRLFRFLVFWGPINL